MSRFLRSGIIELATGVFGSVHERDVVLHPSVGFAGTLLDEDERPIADAEVELTRGDDGTRAAASTTTDGFGRFHSSGLAPGQYRTRVTVFGRKHVLASPVVVGSTDTVDGRLQVTLGAELG